MTTEGEKHFLKQNPIEVTEEEDEYGRNFGGYRPRFEGIPEGTYPNTWKNILIILAGLCLVYIISGGLFAFLLWLLFRNTVTVSWVFAGIGLAYVIMIVSAIFVGQMYRRRLEQQYMEEALEKFHKKDTQARADIQTRV